MFDTVQEEKIQRSNLDISENRKVKSTVQRKNSNRGVFDKWI